MDYQEQQKQNEEAFRKGLQIMRPDLFHLMGALDNSGLDYMILIYFILALERVVDGTGYGNVTTFVENKIITFIKGDESRKINLPAKS